MSGGEIAALVAAGGFVVLVLVLAVPLLRLRHTVDATTRAIRDLNDRTAPILGKVDASMDEVNIALGQARTSLENVNLQLHRVDQITGHAASVTGNVANLVQTVTAVSANPLVKAAAFGYGVRRAAVRRARAEEDEGARSPRRRRGRRRRRGDRAD